MLVSCREGEEEEEEGGKPLAVDTGDLHAVAMCLSAAPRAPPGEPMRPGLSGVLSAESAGGYLLLADQSD